jgi:hypothetical protein
MRDVGSTERRPPGTSSRPVVRSQTGLRPCAHSRRLLCSPEHRQATNELATELASASCCTGSMADERFRPQAGACGCGPARSHSPTGRPAGSRAQWRRLNHAGRRRPAIPLPRTRSSQPGRPDDRVARRSRRAKADGPSHAPDYPISTSEFGAAGVSDPKDQRTRAAAAFYPVQPGTSLRGIKASWGVSSATPMSAGSLMSKCDRIPSFG